MNITLAQREALDVVKDMIDKSNTSIPDYGTKIMTLIFGILNVDCRVEHTGADIPDITDIGVGKSIPIDLVPNDGNDKIQINIPNIPGVQVFPGDIVHPNPSPFPPQVWYTHEPKPVQTDAREDVRYATEVVCTENKNCITTTRNPNDCITYTGTATLNIPDGPPVEYTTK